MSTAAAYSPYDVVPEHDPLRGLRLTNQPTQRLDAFTERLALLQARESELRRLIAVAEGLLSAAELLVVPTSLLLTAQEVAAKLDSTTAKVRRMNTQGRLPEPLAIGGAVRWDAWRFSRWLVIGRPTRREWELIAEANADRPAADSEYSVESLSRALQISVRTCWRMVASGAIPKPANRGRQVYWRGADVVRWIEKGCPIVNIAAKRNRRGIAGA